MISALWFSCWCRLTRQDTGPELIPTKRLYFYSLPADVYDFFEKYRKKTSVSYLGTVKLEFEKKIFKYLQFRMNYEKNKD
ncbi:hypothetical protein BpHYR1_008079 [Brachionus plicatilis]|uniref:Uncharacterized protein n=1 Tax=Brachionus plicatilis TaxID=10195 RepID=A0A3M7RQG3_BRAPC|nr:hypothetical protein BpHYR1_008079 [Brachionus plicatilis]